MEEINLTEEQRLYLQYILDYWRKTSKWPTYRYLDNNFCQSHPELDIENIWKSLPQGLTSYMDINQSDSKATLTVPAIYLLEKNAPEFPHFLKVLKLCVDNYMMSDENSINSEAILKCHRDLEKSVHRIGLLLQGEPNICQDFWELDDSCWICKTIRTVRRFSDISTIEEYLGKRDLYPKAASIPSDPETPIINTSISAECTLHPDIHEQCWSLYEQGHYDNAILNATKAIEVAVRGKSSLPANIVGADLMAQAFKVDKPILTYSSVRAEQEGIIALLRGIIMVYKNPQSHRFVGIQNKSECLGIMIMCSNLLYVIDNINVSQGALV
jgi:uncharacterized protein (TIGR02391 family)